MTTHTKTVPADDFVLVWAAAEQARTAEHRRVVLDDYRRQCQTPPVIEVIRRHRKRGA
jgi:hypothetical protein